MTREPERTSATVSGTGDADGAAAATFCATLVDAWVRRGVRHAVIAPGSRSTPMALAIAARPEIAVHVFHDERSAGFAALGIGLASGSPALVLTTSGTAAVNLHPAVVEAHHSAVPMLVLTADRPPELRDVAAPQAIDQTHLFGVAVRWFHDPGVPDAGACGTWRALAVRAHDAACGAHPGPVHLNLPLREPLVGVPRELPPHIERATATGSALLDDAALDVLAGRLDRQRGVIVAGRGAGDPAAVAELAAAAGWPVLAEPRSGCTGLPGAITAFDALLRHQRFAADHTPEIVLQLGEAPASKVLAQWVAACPATVVQVGAHPTVTDPQNRVTDRVVADPSALCRSFAARLRGASGSPWAARWRHAQERAQAAVTAYLGARAGLSEPAVARTVAHAVPPGGVLVASSSMPVRDLEWYGDVPAGVRVLSNRGANGIDGVVSTAVGAGLASGGPVVLLIGDIALLHDGNGLAALARRGVDLRVVVVDNDGGGIFSFLPQRAALPTERFELLFGTPHGTDVIALAAAHGIAGATVEGADALRAALARPGPHLTRVVTDRADNVVLHGELVAAVAAALDAP